MLGHSDFTSPLSEISKVLLIDLSPGEEQLLLLSHISSCLGLNPLVLADSLGCCLACLHRYSMHVAHTEVNIPVYLGPTLIKNNVNFLHFFPFLSALSCNFSLHFSLYTFLCALSFLQWDLIALHSVQTLGKRTQYSKKNMSLPKH